MLRLGLLVSILVGVTATAPPRYEVASGSRVWIDGTATTGAWTCEADEVRGHGLVADGADLAAEGTVPVRDFDCGSGPMNRDLYRALQADAHPTIAFVLTHADAPRAGAVGAWAPVRAIGTLQIAGATRRVSVAAEGRRLGDGRVALRGEHALRMTDFGIRPPSHALGLVRAHDAIVARFDLVAVAR
ncbi:MAG: hypothetical protein CMM85_05000 [Rhodothermaceae bacterium]|nr:hypothetical protein [Rhodothermaceae bacterium]